MKDFWQQLENEFSRRHNSKPQGGVYEHFVCLRRRDSIVDGWPAGQPHRLTFKQDKWNGDIKLEVDGKPYMWYADWNTVMNDWLLPREITVYDVDCPSASQIKINEEGPECFYDGQ